MKRREVILLCESDYCSNSAIKDLFSVLYQAKFRVIIQKVKLAFRILHLHLQVLAHSSRMSLLYTQIGHWKHLTRYEHGKKTKYSNVEEQMYYLKFVGLFGIIFQSIQFVITVCLI